MPGPLGEGGPGGECVGVLRPVHPLADRQQLGVQVAGRDRINPRPPVHPARFSRALRVAGCSGPPTGSVLLGMYWRSSPSMFSFEPRCHD